MNKKLLTLVLVLGMNTVHAWSEGIALLTLADNYNTRGIICNRDPVLQGFFDASLSNGLGLIIFENIDLTDIAGNRNKVTELDIIPTYTVSLENDNKIVLGAAQYTFPNTTYPDTYELFGKFVNPNYNATYWYDVKEINSWYSSVSLTPMYNINSLFDIGAVGTVGYAGEGYNKGYFGVGENAFNDLTTGLWLSLTKGNIVTTVSAGYIYLLDEEVREGAEEWYGKGETSTLTVSLMYMF